MLRVHNSRSFCRILSRSCTKSGVWSNSASRRAQFSSLKPWHPNGEVASHALLFCQGGSMGALLGCSWHMLVPRSFTKTTSCEMQVANTGVVPEATKVVIKFERPKSMWGKAKHILRVLKRVFKLMLALSPIAALYPIQILLNRNKEDEDAQDVVLASLRDSEIPDGPLGWYYRLCLQCVEWSGAATIKIMQWAGSRPDMFGQAFCRVFSQLQDDTTPHPWKHTEKVLLEAYGDEWKEHIRLDEILGSGCIAQVYKGVIFLDNGEEKEVAVKVMHPNVEDDIDTDLEIMRFAGKAAEMVPFDVMKNLKWLNLGGFIDEMENMLKIQLDLRTEADHLVRFNENFKDNEMITFPKLVEGYRPRKNILFETFCEGVPIMEFVRNNSSNRELLTSMCRDAIKAVCHMIFLDNFVHGDLHPGNVLVSPDNKFVLLDVGIVTEYSEKDHRLISDVLAAFIRCQGRKAGRLMIDDSNSRLRGEGVQAVEEEKYIDKIELLTIEARGKDYFMQKLGTYISYICDAAAQHHVMLNQSFISAALAVKLQEGIALAMDPSIEIWRIAIPIILEGERKHGLVTQRAKEAMGVQSLIEWITGRSNGNEKSTL